MIEKVTIGPLFHVLKAGSSHEASVLFTAFGMAFEQYIQEIFRRAFPKPPIELFDPLRIHRAVVFLWRTFFKLDKIHAMWKYRDTRSADCCKPRAR